MKPWLFGWRLRFVLWWFNAPIGSDLLSLILFLESHESWAQQELGVQIHCAWISSQSSCGEPTQFSRPSIIVTHLKGVTFTCTYLIFVIFFTQAKILDRKCYTEERVYYGKRISRQNSVNCDLLAQTNHTHENHEKKKRLGFSSLSFLTEESAC